MENLIDLYGIEDILKEVVSLQDILPFDIVNEDKTIISEK